MFTLPGWQLLYLQKIRTKMFDNLKHYGDISQSRWDRLKPLCLEILKAVPTRVSCAKS